MSGTNGYPGIAGQRVIVTAGAAGIGLAIARGFCEAGARVHICDTDAAALAALAKSDPEIGASQADVAEPDQVARLFEEALGRLGGLEVLVNNAGIAGPTAPIESCDLDGWRRTLAVNLDGHFLCTRLAVPHMKEAQRGSIVNLSSAAGILGFPLRAPYATAKWGVVGLTKTLAMELGPWNIRVNAICPGPVEGPRIDRVIKADAESRGLEEAEVREAYLKQTSMRVFVSAADIAHMVLFICSDAGARISGQALSVDGHTEKLGI